MKRFLAVALTALSLAISIHPTPVFAQAAVGVPSTASFEWQPLWMRNTSAASIARQANWAIGSPGGYQTPGFADSTVWRKVSGQTAYDTTAAYDLRRIPYNPQFGNSAQNALTDSSAVPFIGLFFKQDTLAYSFTGTSTGDSLYIGAEVSSDGINWQSVVGTPTVAFTVAYFTSGADGTADPAVPVIERVPGADEFGPLFLKCHPSTTGNSATLIINRGLCMYPGWIRFIIGGDENGQWAGQIGMWRDPSGPNN